VERQVDTGHDVHHQRADLAKLLSFCAAFAAFTFDNRCLTRPPRRQRFSEGSGDGEANSSSTAPLPAKSTQTFGSPGRGKSPTISDLRKTDSKKLIRLVVPIFCI
jgi:hypothetical protein